MVGEHAALSTRGPEHDSTTGNQAHCLIPATNRSKHGTTH